MNRSRDVVPDGLPATVTVLTTQDGSRVYLVGTAHFSKESQQDVIRTIQITQPDTVMVELCRRRVNVLTMDEEAILKIAETVTNEEIISAIRKGAAGHLLFVMMTASITKELGMAPGGEFRAAFRECKKIPGSKLVLGDRDIGITMRRFTDSLSWSQALRFYGYMTIMALTMMRKGFITQDMVEKFKDRDFLDEALRQWQGKFPVLHSVLVAERDIYMVHSLRQSLKPVRDPRSATGFVPSVVVGVVGMGHIPGIIDNWNKKNLPSIDELVTVRQTPRTSRFITGACVGSFMGLGLGLVVVAGYKSVRGVYRFLAPRLRASSTKK